MTKKEIVKQISERANLTQLKTKEIVQWTFDAIIETLATEGRIELRNFGVFEVRERKARKARNPRTGEPVEVEPKNVVTFQPGKEMEERVKTTKAIGSKRKTPVMIDDEDEDMEDSMPSPASHAETEREDRETPEPVAVGVMDSMNGVREPMGNEMSDAGAPLKPR